MIDFTLLFIFVCIVVQIIYWIVTAFSVKKTSKSKGGWIMRILAIIIVGSAIFLRKQMAVLIPIMDDNFYPHSLATGLIADIVVLFGVTVMISARVALGENWSANVVLKEGHELVMTGPYAYVRHPIYSGVILIVLGVAIYSGSFVGYLLFVLFFFGAYYKAYKEEKLLIGHFSEKYILYKKKVRAIVPFIC